MKFAHNTHLRASNDGIRTWTLIKLGKSPSTAHIMSECTYMYVDWMWRWPMRCEHARYQRGLRSHFFLLSSSLESASSGKNGQHYTHLRSVNARLILIWCNARNGSMEPQPQPPLCGPQWQRRPFFAYRRAPALGCPQNGSVRSAGMTHGIMSESSHLMHQSVRVRSAPALPLSPFTCAYSQSASEHISRKLRGKCNRRVCVCLCAADRITKSIICL